MSNEHGRQPPRESSDFPQSVDRLLPFLEDWYQNNGLPDSGEARFLKGMVQDYTVNGNEACANCVKEFAKTKKMPVEFE